ncbi:LysM peptidoglycan-binding domain-containing protein [Marivita sp. S6314]|uniref:LysM peptidoglycan-binding domain-containing protein n=1 Tax=Marivita sp. S6314 TaxID=2926406 RepID=UPI001FF530F2|nr:LysM peptidoglycan-binding domain-containing protein [Marivita sp. S6314]MCK0150292.1 LysM peptidoglycan-binding domain-containing protein [Marivita sp. S6314]
MKDTSRNSGLIRMALMATAFIALTIVLVVFQPGSPRQANTSVTEVETTVTRVAPPLDNVASISADSAQTEARTAPQRELATDTGPAQPTTIRDMTFDAISNLKSATTGDAPAPGEPGSLLHSVVQRSIATTAPTSPAQPTTQNTVSATTYAVRPGDTLVSIARALYGDVNMASAIFMANTHVMARPDNLRPGMVLDLPAD